MQMWAWDHFTFLRPIPPPVPLMGVPFPRGLFGADAELALEPADDNCYVGRLSFELLVPAQVIGFLLPFQFMLIYLFDISLLFSGDLASLW